MNIEHWKPDDTTTRTRLKGEDSYTSRRDENSYNEMNEDVKFYSHNLF